MGTIAEEIAEAWRLHQAGRLEEAVRRYQVLLQTAPSRAEVWYLHGAACQVLGRVEEAIESYQQALRLRPNFAEVYSNLGLAYKTQGRVADAIANYREAIRIDPRGPASYSNLGLSLADIGQFDEAEANLRERSAFNRTFRRPITIWLQPCSGKASWTRRQRVTAVLWNCDRISSRRTTTWALR